MIFLVEFFITTKKVCSHRKLLIGINNILEDYSYKLLRCSLLT